MAWPERLSAKGVNRYPTLATLAHECFISAVRVKKERVMAEFKIEESCNFTFATANGLGRYCPLPRNHKQHTENADQVSYLVPPHAFELKPSEPKRAFYSLDDRLKKIDELEARVKELEGKLKVAFKLFEQCDSALQSLMVYLEQADTNLSREGLGQVAELREALKKLKAE